MRIHIMGASCAGSTTLGKALSAELSIPYFDTDDFFWEPSDIPYTVKRDRELRNQSLLNATRTSSSHIVGGSLVQWGDEWFSAFDLVVFLHIPLEIRMQRLVAREIERYGDAIYTNPVRNQLFRDFYEWAIRYDDESFSGRNIRVHRDWLKKVSCPVIQITGDTTVAERVQTVLSAISSELNPE